MSPFEEVGELGSVRRGERLCLEILGMWRWSSSRRIKNRCESEGGRKAVLMGQSGSDWEWRKRSESRRGRGGGEELTGQEAR